MTGFGALFRREMVRALIDKRKRQTRRIDNGKPSLWSRLEPGDRLWVREAYRVTKNRDTVTPRELRPRGLTVMYEAGGSAAGVDSPARFGGSFERSADDYRIDLAWPPAGDLPHWAGRLRPGLDMMRWMSRITLTVVRTHRERLQEMISAEAEAEGFPTHVVEQTFSKCYRDPAERAARRIQCFADYFDTLHGEGMWASNPFVIVTEFETELNNIDVVATARAPRRGNR